MLRCSLLVPILPVVVDATSLGATMAEHEYRASRRIDGCDPVLSRTEAEFHFREAVIGANIMGCFRGMMSEDEMAVDGGGVGRICLRVLIGGL